MIRVGPAGWSYRDWEGIVYPSPKPRGFQPLLLIARMFDLAEINVTFYHPPKPEVAEAWCNLLDRAEAERFRFSVKLWQGLTHSTETPDKGEIEQLRGVCEVLRARGRLAAVLAQFPWSFKNRPTSRSHLMQLAEVWGEFGLAVEVRHGSWDNESFRRWLGESDIALVNIDQPIIGESLGPSAHVTSRRLAYIRLHGRNQDAWFNEQAERDDRYNYLYSSEELAPWAVRIGQASEQAEETLVVANNHFRGQAVTNALELQAAANPDRESPVPQSLVEAYPSLRSVPGLRMAPAEEFTSPESESRRAEADTGQLELF